MPAFRYNLSGNWYKGNTHIHSTVSDGAKTFGELADLYAAEGYHFLFRTDHWAAANVAADSSPYPLLWLDGVELDGVDSGTAYHVVALGTFQGISRSMGLPAALQAVREQGGLLVLAHPHWMGNSFDDAWRIGFEGVEVYNHVCQWLNGKGHALPYWNAMLQRNPHTLAFAADDAHIHESDPGWNGGWVVINAPDCTPESIFAALRSGHYYSSCGPEIYAITASQQQVRLECSPVKFIRLVGPSWWGSRVGSFDGALYTSASFSLPEKLPNYLYLEIEDAQGRRAWTNTLFLENE